MLKPVGLLAGLALIATADHLAAQTTTAAPDKSGYTLFDPTPDDQLRAFCTDRPPKANAACIIDAGHFQYESDIVDMGINIGLTPSTPKVQPYIGISQRFW